MMNPAPLHAIKYQIFERLRTHSEGLRYAQMRPESVENDLFNYHLQQLVRQGMIAKHIDAYELTAAGKAFLHDLNPINAQGQPERFKMAALLVVTQDCGRGLEVLVQQRTRQPSAGETGLIGGGIRRGESAIRAAERRLAEEAGLSASFELIGMVRKIKFDLLGGLYSDILFHVCLARSTTGTLEPRNQFGNQLWLPADQAAALEQIKPDGSLRLAQVLRHLSSSSTAPAMFYEERTYHINPE